MTEPLTREEVLALRWRLDSLTEGLTPGPFHAVESGDRAAYGWWLDNEAGDSSFPSLDDVALFVNTLPKLLAALPSSTERREELDVERLERAIAESMAEPGYGYIDIDRDTSPEYIRDEAERIARFYAALSSPAHGIEATET